MKKDKINFIKNIKKEDYIFLIDIKNLMKINDHYGHSIGDNIIKELIKDLEGLNYLRISGNEFIISAPDFKTNIEVRYVKYPTDRVIYYREIFNEDDDKLIEKIIEENFNALLTMLSNLMYDIKSAMKDSCVVKFK